MIYQMEQRTDRIDEVVLVVTVMRGPYAHHPQQSVAAVIDSLRYNESILDLSVEFRTAFHRYQTFVFLFAYGDAPAAAAGMTEAVGLAGEAQIIPWYQPFIIHDNKLYIQKYCHFNIFHISANVP